MFVCVPISSEVDCFDERSELTLHLSLETMLLDDQTDLRRGTVCRNDGRAVDFDTRATTQVDL